MGRTCREELASGGTLIISENDFRIEYFFPGPDGRYGGVRVNIPGRKVETYMRAWQKNYERYEELQKAAGASVVKRPAAMRGECGMTIPTGFMDGVYLKGSHMRVTERVQLDMIIRDYGYALDRWKKSGQMPESSDC